MTTEIKNNPLTYAKPCPKCGSDKLTAYCRFIRSRYEVLVKVQCVSCKYAGPEVLLRAPSAYDGAMEAVQAWNLKQDAEAAMTEENRED